MVSIKGLLGNGITHAQGTLHAVKPPRCKGPCVREGSSTVSRARSPLRALARGSVWDSTEAKRSVLSSALKVETLLPILEPIPLCAMIMGRQPD